ncbi:nucleoside diphosphate-linked moiety X motif 17 isoform X2 [Dromaius novaehollandiae]|uniref:nucleoside diphosphate-linked moiety X motif 17 isoform X2 n=1 Tax=Dromaius novaehollandiae TaxID=8790 RepID=UPI00311F15C9
MAGLAHVLVHVRRGGVEGPARFGQSVTGAFCAANEDAATVSCRLERGRLILADAAFPGSTETLLERPPGCPAKLLGQQPAAPGTPGPRGVAAAVAVLLQASTRRVLLTRRAAALAGFPDTWVPPGGHAEPGEELLDTGLRELEEETGLRLAAGTFSWRMLGLWESVYPPALSRGPPRRHHVVAYLLLLSAESHERLQARMRPDEREVSAYAWLEPPVLRRIAVPDGAEGTLPAAVSITELRGGSARATEVPPAAFLAAEGDDVERVSGGTKFALRRWLEAAGEPVGP